MKILAADVGGTYIKHAVMNEKAEIFERGKIETPKESHEEFLQAIVEIFKASGAEGIAMSLPGIIDSERGYCRTSGALEYNRHTFIADELSKLCGVKVTIENDAKCAGLAEARIGALADVADGFVMVFGTGVGGAFIKDHEVHRGKNFLAGEVSYMIKNFQEEKFSGGDENYFGVSCSVHTLLRSYTAAKNLPEKVSGEDFFQAAESGDEVALECLAKFSQRAAVQIFNVQMIADPEKIAIGGGISARKIFIDSLRDELAKIYKNLPVDFPSVEIVPCKFRNDANLIGALFRWLKP